MLILASASPRRKELLTLMGLNFVVRVSEADETIYSENAPYDEVARLSRAKAEAISSAPEDIVIAADTIVVCDNQALGKPIDEHDAMRMLTLLSGRKHQVMTGLSVLHAGKCISCTEVTDVFFRTLTAEEICAYIRTKEPMDKAGAYGIQGGAAQFVEKISGDFYNVVGLPVCRLSRILRQIAPQLTEETK